MFYSFRHKKNLSFPSGSEINRTDTKLKICDADNKAQLT